MACVEYLFSHDSKLEKNLSVIKLPSLAALKKAKWPPHQLSPYRYWSTSCMILQAVGALQVNDFSLKFLIIVSLIYIPTSKVNREAESLYERGGLERTSQALSVVFGLGYACATPEPHN